MNARIRRKIRKAALTDYAGYLARYRVSAQLRSQTGDWREFRRRMFGYLNRTKRHARECNKELAG